MTDETTDVLRGALRDALARADLPAVEPELSRPRQREHGDWATNVALQLAKRVGEPPRQVAQRLVDALGQPPGVAEVAIAGPGFINVRLDQGAVADVVRRVVAEGPGYGRSTPADRESVNVEFVSANPTGPLHLGAGRWAAVGDSLAALLEAAGHDVTREYYFNDAGEQMERFRASVEAAIEGREPPGDGYRGAYIDQLAADLRRAGGVTDVGDVGDVGDAAYGRVLTQIQATLTRFRVRFDVFFGERTLHDSGRVTGMVDRLRDAGHVYDADGATWLATTTFGDDKDRVLVRSDGRPTYFAADCAYLDDKRARGFDRLVYVLGADHHGYIRRLRAAAAALGHPPESVEIVLGQLVSFSRGGQSVRMSKRSGELVGLDDLLDEVGVDAARYTFVRTSIDQTLDFDLAEVVRAERDNPVYYVQYSHARIAGILRNAVERGVEAGAVDDAPLHLLTHGTERELLRQVDSLPGVVRDAAAFRAPHRVARYAEELAEAFHRFYVECQVLSADTELTRARLWLTAAARQCITNALDLLGVTAPERM